MKIEQIRLWFVILLLSGLTSWCFSQELQLTTGNNFLTKQIPQLVVNENKITKNQTYSSNSPISITSNAEFDSLNFPGSGAIEDPYRIEGVNITSSSNNLISIVQTTAYFIIANNFFNGLNNSSSGIHLLLANRGTIANNTFKDINGEGIRLERSHNNTINRNIVYNSDRSCTLFLSHNNSIINNIFFNNTKSGVIIEKSHNSLVSNNSFCYNRGSGLILNQSIRSVISKNFIYFNNLFGISLIHTNDSLIFSNHIVNNTLHGIGIDFSSKDNTMKFNNLRGNNLGIEQATDDGIRNRFTYNHWSEWLEPDTDNNGIIDNSYPYIMGTANQSDLYPLVTSPEHVLAPLILIYPNGGESLLGTITVVWVPSVNSLGHPLYYIVYYSSDNGESWKQIASNLTKSTYIWDPESTNINSLKIIIKVTVHDNMGLTIEDTSDNIITIVNTFGATNEFINQLIFVVSLLIIGIGLTACIIFFNSRLNRKKSIDELDLTSQTEFLKNIYHKVIIGLENIRRGLIKGKKKGISLLEAAEPIRTETIETYFTPNIRIDLTSGMKGRTVLLLIEIAYYYPDKTNPAQLAKILDIPPSTLTKEIKRLVNLEYIESYVSQKVLQDGRYRNYTVTQKGVEFLKTLKGALELSIDRLREKQQDIVF
jgi:parallel beta-helix repeat protein